MQKKDLLKELDKKLSIISPKVIEWRRDFHQFPELSNQEFRTASIVASHLSKLGFKVQTEVAKTGVVALLNGKYSGPVVALRADMDALPVTEECTLPFASKEVADYNGQKVGVMHACGHDVHTATLMGVAELLAGIKDELHGSVKFIFQPAEEGAWDSEIWGAKQMINEGVLENPKPDAIFGMHVWPMPLNTIGYREGAFMASVDDLEIEIKGKGTHGAMPWDGIDPIVISAQIVSALQSIVSRNVALNEGAAVVTIGAINGGNRYNIIPETVKMLGTIRTYNEKARTTIHQRITSLVENIANANGANSLVVFKKKYPTTFNNVELTKLMIPTLKKSFTNVKEIYPVMPAEDFSFYQQQIPGLFFFLGILPEEIKDDEIQANHSPRFFVDEKAIPTGIKAFYHLAINYLYSK